MNKINFKIRTMSGGVIRQTFFHKAASLTDLCQECGLKLVESRPDWAFAHYSATTSAEITWIDTE
jgi:hypothetical protein